MSELRLQLRIKTEELDSLKRMLDDTKTNLTSHKAEIVMLKEKVDLLKGQHYEGDAAKKREVSQLVSEKVNRIA